MALRLIEVSHRFGGELALDRVSLHLRPGDCYGFLGHNGAGKTTALRIALGLLRPHAGRVVIDGFDAARHPREARARAGGLVETAGFHGHLSGRANLELLARLQGLARRPARREAERRLADVGLGDAGRKAVGAYSQGMRQRLGIAQAILGDPRVVLLDEPTNGLDPEGIEEMRRLVRRLSREEGRAVLYSSHLLREVEGTCNRIGVLRQGRMLVEDETARLLGGARERYTLESPDPVRARAALDALGVPWEGADEGALVLDLHGREPGALAAELVGRGVPLRTFAPRPASLEEVYLRLGGEVAAGAPHGDRAPFAAAPPEEIRAPRLPTLRAARYELARLASGRSAMLLLLAPTAAVLLSVWHQAREEDRKAAELAAREVFSSTSLTAFAATGRALQWGAPLLALVAAGLASQSLAGELSRGTLRNLLLRPVTRGQAILGKSAALLAVTVAAYALLAGAAAVAAGAVFGFRDVVEVLETGHTFPFRTAEELWPGFRAALVVPLPAIAGCAAVGLAVGAAARGPAAALGGALGALLALDLARIGGGEGWLLSAQLPHPVDDASGVRNFVEAALGFSNPLEPAPRAWLVALLWIAAGVGFAWLALRRRAVP